MGDGLSAECWASIFAVGGVTIAAFIRGDRVFIDDEDAAGELAPHPRLAMVTGAVEPGFGRGAAAAGGGRLVVYGLSVPGVDGQSPHSLLQLPEPRLALAGTLGERYEQVVGPYNDFVMIWTQAIKTGSHSTLSRDIDVIGIHWPDWFLLMEIRGTGVEVPLVRDHLEWQWHMAVMAR